MHFPEKDKIFLQLAKFLQEPTKLIVGVSGGPDSRLVFAVLEDYYRSKGRDTTLLIVAHFHHGQRKTSDKEQQKIFDRYKYFHVYYNDDKPKKGQKETVLRDLRKRFFQEVAEKEKSMYIVTGHHLDDRIETSFMNLLRGTSLEGLANMTFRDYVDGFFHLRPLIALQKWYIQELCNTHHISYFIDQTNKNSSLTIRNALRNDVFPQMTMLSPQNKWYDSWALIYRQIEYRNIEGNNDHIWIQKIQTHPARGATACYKIRLKGTGRSYTETDWVYIFQQLDIHKNVSQKTLAERTRFANTSGDGYKFLSGVYFFLSHGKIYAINGKKDFWEYTNNTQEKVSDKEKHTRFDGVKIKNNPLWEGGVIRYAKPGDVYKGKRVKKRMLNEKIPVFWRNFVPVVEKGGKIIDVIKKVVPVFYVLG